MAILENFKEIIAFKKSCQELSLFCEKLNLANNSHYSLTDILLSDEDQNISYQRHDDKVMKFMNKIEKWGDDFLDRFNNNYG